MLCSIQINHACLEVTLCRLPILYRLQRLQNSEKEIFEQMLPYRYIKHSMLNRKYLTCFALMDEIELKSTHLALF